VTRRWTDACGANDLAAEDVICVERDGRTLAIYRTEAAEYFATDGLCTHENVSLAGGLVMGTTIECPKHNGRFDFRTGTALSPPACVNLKTYPVRVEGDRILIAIG
jgi:3-phenylpropionate/trans-cinnamate dioxygenase ferredoxin subunit